MNWFKKWTFNKIIGLIFFFVGFILGFIVVATNMFMASNAIFWVIIPFALGIIFVLIFIGLICIFRKK
ncbi:hypothetical protein [[Mycoplasma] mobile]|uniref:hypothetical protein n=1 Tax=[Mycoplasma] mobile TaxID=2118 RepID=UPI0002DB7DAC|nr:hypothetical protein [[Mycoplasma] mobile]